MPFILAIPPAYWALGAATGAVAVWMSPPAKPARDAAARAIDRAISRSDVCTTCNVCPNCGKPMANPPDPDFLKSTPPRAPIARETILNGASKASGVSPVNGAPVYNWNGGYAHMDTFHKGKGAEIETYNKKGKHTGTICPICGQSMGGPVKGRDISL